MPKPSKTVEFSERIYRKLLRLYPQSHRQQYSELMAQLFRDQCRDVLRAGCSGGWMKFWLRVLLDIGRSSALEQIAVIERKQIMNYIKNTPTVLLIVGIASGVLSIPLSHSAAAPALFLIAVSGLAIFIRAGLELFRPSHEWKRIVVGTFALMIVYGLLMPAWSKSGLGRTLPPWVPIGQMILIGFFANPVVTLIKFLLFLVERRKV